MGMTIFDSRDPASRAAGELALGMFAIANMFSTSADYIEPAPVPDNRYTAGEVRNMLNRVVRKANAGIKSMRDRGEVAAELVIDLKGKFEAYSEELLETIYEQQATLDANAETIRAQQAEIERLRALRPSPYIVDNMAQ